MALDSLARAPADRQPASPETRAVPSGPLILAALAALWLPSRAPATDYRQIAETIRYVEILTPDLRVELRPSEPLGWVLSWPLTLAVGRPLRRCELGSDYACPAGSAPFLGADLLLEPQVKVGPDAAARLLAGVTLHAGWVRWKEHEPRRQGGPTVALQGGGLLGRDGNGSFAGVGLQWVGNDDGYNKGLSYGFGLWLRAIHTTEGDRVELGLDLAQIPWLLDP